MIKGKQRFFEMVNRELLQLIPSEEARAILSQPECELEPDFLGFVNSYYALSKIIPHEATVIDFGCYLAAQSYFFKDHKQYIGVDVVDWLKRFQPANATHYYESIQDFLQNTFPKLPHSDNDLEYFAICSYVPDFAATEMVRKTFKNVFCFYPFRTSITEKIKAKENKKA